MSFSGFFCSSIGKKVVMAFTGVVLGGFLAGHLLGNFQIFQGQDALNHYGELLHSMPKVIWTVRSCMLIVLLLHITQAINLWVLNRHARGSISYRCKEKVQASTASLYMVHTGMLIALFIVLHLLHFTFQAFHPEYSQMIDSQGRPDIYSMVIRGFQNPWYSGGYALCLIFLGYHLSHAIPSFFQTLGLDHPKYLPLINKGGLMLAVVLTLGYLSIPLSILAGIVTLPGGVG